MSDETHTERLFTAERNLRGAAGVYGTSKNDENRKALRLAALAYAEISNECDEAMEVVLELAAARLRTEAAK